MSAAAACRLCGAELTRTFVDLGMSPPCESYLRADQLDDAEPFYPLHVRICENCLLVQLPAYVTAEDVFSDYLYFSSYSTSWVAHAERFVTEMTDRLRLTDDSFVVEVASNDGYLLQHAVARGIRCPRHRAGRQRRRGGPGEGRADRGDVPRRADRQGRRGPARPGRPGRRQQRVRPRSGPARLHRRACARW